MSSHSHSHTASSATKSRSTSASTHQSTHSTVSSVDPPPPSKMKVFFHRVRKVLKVDEQQALPPRLQYRYLKLKKYETKMRKLYETVRVIVIRDPIEVKRAREGNSPGPFHPAKDNSIYQNLYRPLSKHKNSFSQYKNFDPLSRMIWDLGKLEVEHQQETETIFAEIARFLAEDCNIVEDKMKTLNEARENLDFRKSQSKAGVTQAERDMNRRLYAEAQARFEDQCNDVKETMKKMLRARKEHGKSIGQWILARAQWHKKMEQRMGEAGIAKVPWKKPEKTKSTEENKKHPKKKDKSKTNK